MAIGSQDLAPGQLRGFDDDRLVEELRKAKEELFNLRFQSATGQLESHGRLRAVRGAHGAYYVNLRDLAALSKPHRGWPEPREVTASQLEGSWDLVEGTLGRARAWRDRPPLRHPRSPR